MAFQPLGYRFELYSRMTPAEAKAALRRKRKKWLDPKNGARGWIVGPLVCLWWSALNPEGPMLVALLRNDGAGCRIRGRAGSDLNSTMALLIVLPIFLALVAAAASNEPAPTFAPLILVAPFACVGVAWALWVRSRQRRDAKPLVHFVGKTLKSEAHAPPPAKLGEELKGRQ